MDRKQPKNRKLPEHIPGTIRQWRSRKRQELRAIEKAWGKFRLGCAYTPAYVLERGERVGWENGPRWPTVFPVKDIEESIKELRKRLSVKNWGK